MDIQAFALLLLGQVVGYLVGGIPFGYLLTRWKTGLDIRTLGSGNIGATNVGRVLGFPYFIAVFVLDFLKGALPVLGAAWIGTEGGQAITPYLPEVVGFAAILGHIFPIYLGMKGGKGVATAIGVLLCLAPIATISGIGAWVVLVLATRMISVGSIGFAIVFAAVHFVRMEEPFSTANVVLSGVVLLVAGLVLVRHGGNVRRIIAGTEPRIEFPWSKGRKG